MLLWQGQLVLDMHANKDKGRPIVSWMFSKNLRPGSRPSIGENRFHGSFFFPVLFWNPLTQYPLVYRVLLDISWFPVSSRVILGSIRRQNVVKGRMLSIGQRQCSLSAGLTDPFWVSVHWFLQDTNHVWLAGFGWVRVSIGKLPFFWKATISMGESWAVGCYIWFVIISEFSTMLVLLAQVFGMNYLDQLLGTIHVVSNALSRQKGRFLAIYLPSS